MSRTSRLEGFFKLTLEQRVETLKNATGVDLGPLTDSALTAAQADLMVENAVGVFGVPLGIATNFVLDGEELLVPMAIEEPSVIAAASNAARMVRQGSGFITRADPPLSAVQIEIHSPGPEAADRLVNAAPAIIDLANQTQPELVALGGGARELVIREAVGRNERMVVHLLVDCKDAMGANIVNTMAEAVSVEIARLASGQAGLRILTNLADRRLVEVTCAIPWAALARRGFPGQDVGQGVVRATDFAQADPYRAATHNKGIFNGIDAVLLATGNDWRAVEAGGHAYAARKGGYAPLTDWTITADCLCGRLELPLAAGIVGGAARVHPMARKCIELLGVKRGVDLAKIAAAAGLATNLAALAALACEGIQHGHMRLHIRKISVPSKP